MKYIIIVFCLLLILAAFIILFKFIKESAKGKCCGNCHQCNITNCKSSKKLHH